MPRRTTEFRGFSGFDAPAQNPFIRFPGGRALTSDVNDAGMSLDFGGGNTGGTRGAPTVQTPTAQPSRGLTGDNSNAGLVNRNLFREDNQANTDWWVARDDTPAVSATASASPRSSASGGLSGEAVFGEPTVQTPTSDARYTFDYDNAASLFPDQNEWWRDGQLAQGASTSNEGGGIWEGSETIGDFGGDLTLGEDLNADLGSLNFGEDYPAIETTGSPFDSLAEGNDIPIEPDVLDQEYEWTTSPGDRRFLGGPPEEETPRNVAGNISTGGTSLSDFGGNMSLGQFLNTPLAMMNFGGGYPVQGGVVDTSFAGATATGAIQTDPTTGRPFDLDAIPTATGGTTYTAPEEGWQSNAESNGRNDGTGTTTVQIPTGNNSMPSGLRIIGYDTRNGQPIYEDSQGNRFVNPGTGTPISPGIAAAVGRDYESAYGQSQLSRDSAFTMMMAGMNLQMNPKMITGTGDAGHTMFNMGRTNRDRPNVTFENGQIVRQPGGRTFGGSGNRSQVGGLG